MARAAPSPRPNNVATAKSPTAKPTTKTKAASGAKAPAKAQAFFKAHAAAAQASSKANGIPASVILAQAALESGYGRKATKGHNYFGVKGKGPAGSTKDATHEVVAGKSKAIKADFRAYASAEESFKDHGKLLKENKNFAKALEHANDPEQFARELQNAHYATDPKYADKLISIMKKYGLDAYDEPKRR